MKRKATDWLSLGTTPDWIKTTENLLWIKFSYKTASVWLTEIVVIHIRIVEHLSSQTKSECPNKYISYTTYIPLDMGSLYVEEFFVFLYIQSFV